QFLRAQAFVAQFFNFSENFRFDQRELVRRGAGIEREVSGLQAKEMLRADVISEPKFITNADEQARTQITERFLQQFERVAAWIMNGDARERQNDDALFLIAIFRNADHLGKVQAALLLLHDRFSERFPIPEPF